MFSDLLTMYLSMGRRKEIFQIKNCTEANPPYLCLLNTSSEYTSEVADNVDSSSSGSLQGDPPLLWAAAYVFWRKCAKGPYVPSTLGKWTPASCSVKCELHEGGLQLFCSLVAPGRRHSLRLYYLTSVKRAVLTTPQCFFKSLNLPLVKR